MTFFKPQSGKESDKMTKETRQARFRGCKLVALLVVGIAVGAYADGATSRIRHIADTYLQSDGTQIIDTGTRYTSAKLPDHIAPGGAIRIAGGGTMILFR